MAKTNLERAIQDAAGDFALEIVEAIKNATLQELMSLQEGAPGGARTARPGPKSSPSKPKPAKKKSKKRVARNYPKCAFPSCNNNRFVRGKGFCGEHWKLWLTGKIKSADEYAKQSS